MSGETRRKAQAPESAGAERAEELLPLVYEELRRVAASKMAWENPGQTLQATALVHEAWLKLCGKGPWNGRTHFFATAAETMRRILIDRARRKKARIRAVPGIEVEDLRLVHPASAEELLAVNDALEQLAEVDAIAARLVELRFFVGLTSGEAAVALGMSPRSAERLWTFARAWLHRKLGSDLPGST